MAGIYVSGSYLPTTYANNYFAGFPPVEASSECWQMVHSDIYGGWIVSLNGGELQAGCKDADFNCEDVTVFSELLAWTGEGPPPLPIYAYPFAAG